MKQILKNKWMILFIAFVIGMSFINSEIKKDSDTTNEQNQVIINK